MGDGFRALPAVGTLVADGRVRGVSTLEDGALARLVGEVVAEVRSTIAGGECLVREEIEALVVARVAEFERARLRGVINATGVIVHTNLGRAPVSKETAAAMGEAAAHYVPLEIEPGTNERGGRLQEISGLMRLLTGAEATLVVNNNAAAVVLVLSALAAGGDVVVSRGEAVEVGGGFRIPDVLRQSGARLVEVGTTNRTYARDYAEVTDEATAAYLKVHPSNFRITGFVHAASTRELAILGRERSVPVLEDVGSGALLDTARFGLAHEPTLQEGLDAGATLVMASGDKLLGGPQAGIIVGKQAWVEKVARHPLARAVRADKTCLAGVATTLRHYARGDAETALPVWRMIAAREETLRARADGMRTRLTEQGVKVEVEETRATVGGGSLPGETLPSWAVLVPGGRDVDGVAKRLRVGEPGVFGRIEQDRVVLDLRTVLPEEEEGLLEAVGRARNSLAEAS